MATASRQSLEDLVRAARKIEQPDKIVWEIDAHKLNVWVADSDERPVRPYLIILNELYPRGFVLCSSLPGKASNHHIKPDAKQLARFVLEAILDPPTGSPVRRPEFLHCSDKKLIEPLERILGQAGIRVSYLTKADGIQNYVQTYSQKLIEKDLATQGEAGALPSITGAPGVTDDLLMRCMRNFVLLYHSAPWNRGFSENLAFGISFDSVTIETEIANYINVLGFLDKRSRGFAAGKSLRAMKLKFMKVTVPEAENIDAFADTEFRCAGCGVEFEAGQDVFRCAACKFILYCSSECQKADWVLETGHHVECQNWRKMTSPPASIVRMCWRRRELVLLFAEDVATPFADLDFIEEHEIEMPHDEFQDEDGKTRTVTLYPFPFVTVSGGGFTPTVVRPTVQELRWIEAAACALTATTEVPGREPGHQQIKVDVQKCTIEWKADFASSS